MLAPHTVILGLLDIDNPNFSQTHHLARVGHGTDYYQQGFFNWTPSETNPWDDLRLTSTGSDAEAITAESTSRRQDAAWRPGNTAEIQQYGGNSATYQVQYDKLWKQTGGFTC